MNEEINLKNLWKQNPNFNHLPHFYGSFVLPVYHVKLEYLDHGLQDYIRDFGKEDAAWKINLCKQMLAALREMHEVKYVHRDVKPDNFMVH